LVPAGRRTVADRFEPSIAGGIVAEQDVVGAIAKVVTDCDDGVAGVRAADLLPACKRAVTDRLDPGVA
jgi:hypothetical protein